MIQRRLLPTSRGQMKRSMALIAVLVASHQKGRGRFGVTAAANTGDGLGGGPPPTGFSPLNSPSTTVYNPEPSLRYELPRVFLDSRYNPGGVALTFASDITLVDSGDFTTNTTNLQGAIDAAAGRIGHSRIKLPSGWISGDARGRNNTQGAYWTYVEWTGIDAAQAEGVQSNYTTVATTHAQAPVINSPSFGSGALWFDRSSHHYRFTGIIFRTLGTTSLTYRLVYIQGNGSDSQASDETVQTSAAVAPNWIILDRCWVDGQDKRTVRLGVALNGKNCCLVDSVVSGICARGFDSQAVTAYNSPGPLKVVGCSLEATSINFLIGGVVPDIPGVNTADVEYRRNYHWKRLTWNRNDVTFAGPESDRNQLIVKNLWELKWGVRVFVEGCVFVNCWADAQAGFPIVIKTENSVALDDPGGNPGALCRDVVMRHCFMDNVSGAFDLQGKGYGGLLDTQSSHLEIHNWLVKRIGADIWNKLDDQNVNPVGFAISDNFNHLLVDHLTLVLTPQAHTAWGKPINLIYRGWNMPELAWQNSILAIPAPNGGQTLYQSSFPTPAVEGTGALDAICGSGQWTFAKNVLPGALQNGNPYPAASEYPVNIAAIGFVDYAGGDLRLAASSPYAGFCADASDPGCNKTRVDLATSGVAP